MPDEAEDTLTTVAERDIPFAPVPTANSVGVVQTEANEVLIAIEFRTPTGTQVYFYTPEGANKLAASIMRQGRTAFAIEAKQARLVRADGSKLL